MVPLKDLRERQTGMFPEKGAKTDRHRLTVAETKAERQLQRAGAKRAVGCLRVVAPDHLQVQALSQGCGGPPAAWLKRNVGSKAGSPLEGQACAL